MDFLEPLQVLWDYLHLGQEPEAADVILGFGSFDDNVARRAAELYRQGLAPRILFTGGLGRCTSGRFPEPEAVRFQQVAMALGVPEDAILLEPHSGNTKENIEFSRAVLQSARVPCGRILGVHKPYMERRIAAAMGVYWPQVHFCVTSPRMSVQEYLAQSARQGLPEEEAISVIVGDFQRIDLYARLGYQLPQEIPDGAWQAFFALVAMGYDSQLAK